MTTKTMAEEMALDWTLKAHVMAVEDLVKDARNYGTVMERRTPFGTDKVVINYKDGSRHTNNQLTFK